MISYKVECKHNIPDEYFVQYNNIVRFAFNRWSEGASQTEIENKIKTTMNNIDLMDSSLISMATNSVKALKNKKDVIFGSRRLFMKLKYNKSIDKQLWHTSRNPSIQLRGAKDRNGNRKASLDIENSKIIFKPERNIKFEINLQKDRRFKTLLLLQSLCEEKKTFYSLDIYREYVIITFDEMILSAYNITQFKPINNRLLSIDLNPNYIGLVISNTNEIIHKEIINLSALNVAGKNKKIYEISQINQRIIKLAKHYKVSGIAFEKLSIYNKDHNRGKYYNKLLNNQWNRDTFIKNLIKKCKIFSINYYEIDSHYSSFVGCLVNNIEYDSVAAAIEIGRRARELCCKQSYKWFPEIDLISITTRWKEMLGNEVHSFSWKNLYDWFKKNPKCNYRILFDLKKFKGFSFRLKSHASNVNIHCV